MGRKQCSWIGRTSLRKRERMRKLKIKYNEYIQGKRMEKFLQRNIPELVALKPSTSINAEKTFVLKHDSDTDTADEIREGIKQENDADDTCMLNLKHENDTDTADEICETIKHENDEAAVEQQSIDPTPFSISTETVENKYMIQNEVAWGLKPCHVQLEKLPEHIQNERTYRTLNEKGYLKIRELLAPFKCIHCSRTFKYLCLLKLHERTHRPVSTVAFQCSKTFEYQYHLKTHEIMYSKDYPFRCKYCKNTFTLMNRLKSHERKQRKLLMSENGKFKCKHCSKRFKYECQMKEHERKHIKTTRFQCKLCSIRFKYLCCMNAHKKMHSN